MAFSGFRIMWLQVFFDLPVLTKEARKAATDFRAFLLDNGFEMAQYSVYQRFCAGRPMAETMIKRVEKNLPKEGKVHILTFTDKQYENIRTFRGRDRGKSPENPEQYQLF